MAELLSFPLRQDNWFFSSLQFCFGWLESCTGEKGFFAYKSSAGRALGPVIVRLSRITYIILRCVAEDID